MKRNNPENPMSDLNQGEDETMRTRINKWIIYLKNLRMEKWTNKDYKKI